MDEGTTPTGIGRRLREIRNWRGLSLRTTAGLAGYSASYLSQIENGLAPVDKRSTLEAFAAALRVAPSELGSSFPPSGHPDDAYAPARSALTAVEDALTDIEVGETTRAPVEWPDIARRLGELAAARHHADYTNQCLLLPGLLADLNTAVGGEHRRAALVGLCTAYKSAAMSARTLGVRGLPAFAAWRARCAAEELDDPAWRALAAMTTASTSGRARAIVIVDRAVDQLTGLLDDPRCREMTGALHLNAALSEATLGRPDRAAERLDEAAALAAGLPDGHGFGGTLFGPTNVRVWRMSVAVETGEGGRVRELASGWDVRAIPSPGRHADYWAELGRGLASSRAGRDDAVRALLRAEGLAPQRIRAHPLLRETVGGLLQRVRRDDAVGRELRGLAFRMGLAG